MSAMTMTLDLHAPRFAWREHGVALGAAVALHLGLAVVLLNLSHTSPLPPAISVVMTTELVTLPAPVVQPPASPVPTQPIISPPAPAPQPMVAAPPVEQADLAFKRVEQQRQQEKARQLKREQQQRIEETRRQEQVARETQQRQALEREQQLAQARQAQADLNAAAARAQAEAANSQYLPIAKQAPDYPQRALDRKIEGECTVAYRVNAQGRVEDPQVLGECHPLFVKPSLAAAKTFRYQPKIVNGQAVAVASVKNTFSFKIR